MNKILIRIIYIYCSHYSSVANSGIIYMWMLCASYVLYAFSQIARIARVTERVLVHKLLEAPEEPLERKRTHELDFIP